MPRQRTGTLVLRKGVWHARIMVGKGKGAKREWFDLGTSDKTIAGRKLARMVADLEGGRPLDLGAPGVKSERVDDYAEALFKAREARGVVMVRDERMYFRTRIQEKIGKLYLCDVKPAHVAKLLDDAIEAGLKRETIKAIRGVAHRIFEAAWRAELIESNPVDRVEVPKMREVKKQRVILTDPEFRQFIGHPEVDLEIKMLATCSRVLGGMRTGDLIAWDWSMVDRAQFAAAFIPRGKTGNFDELEIPEPLRPLLKARWQDRDEPETGPMFPVERGRRAGEARKQRAQSFAKRFRRNLFRAGVVRAKPIEVDAKKPGQRVDLGKTCDGKKLAPNPRDPLYHETATTLPVDFHSFRRAFSTALAEAGVNAQQAMKLAHHSDAKVHARYVMNTDAMKRIPDAAVPLLPLPPVTNGDKSARSRENQGSSDEDPEDPDRGPFPGRTSKKAYKPRTSKPRVTGSSPVGRAEKQGSSDRIVTAGDKWTPGSPDPSEERALRRKALTLALQVAAEADDAETVRELAAELRALRLEEQDAAGVVRLDARKHGG